MSASNDAGAVISIVIFAITWAIPILFAVFLFRTLGTIVEGLRSINAGVQRMSTTLDTLVEELRAGRRQAGEHGHDDSGDG